MIGLVYIILQDKKAESSLLLHLYQDTMFQNFLPPSFEGNNYNFFPDFMKSLLHGSVYRTNACYSITSTLYTYLVLAFTMIGIQSAIMACLV